MATNLLSTQSQDSKDPTPSSKLPKYLQEDDLTEEVQALISTLPREQGWILSYLYQYKGFWYLSNLFQGLLSCERRFQARDTDIILITSPKCGTTWLKALAYAVVNRKINPPKEVNHPLLSNNPHELVPFLERMVYVDHQHPDLIESSSPRVLSTHLPLELLPLSIKESGCKVVYLARNPKDAFISLWHYANKMRPQDGGKLTLEEAFDKFCKGITCCGPFWDHVLSSWKYSLDNPNKLFFLKYEELKEQPKMYLMTLAEFWGCPFSLEEENCGVVDEILNLCSFDNLRNLEINKVGKLFTGEQNKAYFRKGEFGDWVNYFTPEMTQKFDEIYMNKFQPYGLKF